MKTRHAQVLAAHFIALTLLGLVGCTTSTKESEPELESAAPQRLNYTLRAGTSVSYAAPLPTRTDYFVDWHYSDGRTEELTGFHAWDFMGQGRYSMVEVLGMDGRTVRYLYDFDGDGSNDLDLAIAGAESEP